MLNTSKLILESVSSKVNLICLRLITSFFEPLFASIPSFATEPALIIVAATFLSSLRNVNWDDVSETLPVLVIILVVPLTFSIAAGIAFVFFVFVGMKSLVVEFGDFTPEVWVI